MGGADHDLRAFWENVAGRKTFTTPLPAEVLASCVPRGGRVLDLGAGYGRTLEVLRRLGYERLVGVDYSLNMVRHAREAGSPDAWAVADARRLPFRDGSFDCILMLALLTCVPTDEAQLALVREAGRVLAPGGHILLNDFLLNDDPRSRLRYRRFESRFGKYGVFEVEGGGTVRHHAKEWLLALFGPLEVLRCAEDVFVTMNGNPARGLRLVARKPRA